MSPRTQAAPLLLTLTFSILAMARSETQNTVPNNFTIVQWNVRGHFNTRMLDLQDTLGFLPDVLAIQETLLDKDAIIPITLADKYNVIRHGEKSKHTNKKDDFPKRGIITCVKKCHPFRTHLKHDDKYGTLTITEIYVHGKQRLHIANTYIKHQHGPRSNDEEKAGLRKILENPLRKLDDIILVGDFNCHNAIWGSSYNCHKGELVADIAYKNNMIIENRGHYTHINTHTENTCIDLTISKVKTNIGNHTWETLDPHGSDHLPILSTWGPNINYNEVEMGKIRFRLDKANWDDFSELWRGVEVTEIADEDITTYKNNLVYKFKEIAKQSMPYKDNSTREGRGKNRNTEKREKTVPWSDEEFRNLKQERVLALRKWTKSREEEDWNRYKKLRNKATNMCRQKWAGALEKELETVDSDTSGSKVWNIIKTMEGKKGSSSTNIAPLVDRHGYEAKTDREKANVLGENLAHNSSDNNYTDKFRKFKQNHIQKNRHLLRKKQTIEASQTYNTPITMKELEDTIKQKGNSAPGEDSIQYPMFKNLPTNALDILLHFYNAIWETGGIPLDFKHAIVVPIYKTDKPINDPSSYRPIALTDHIGKILETIVTNRLNAYLEERGIIKNSQSGFRGKRQTLDHLSKIVHTAQHCKDREKITGAVFLDLEKAYDLLWREGCLEEVEKIGISGKLYNYVLDFLQDRTFQVKINSTLSETFKQQNGVPQGAVISPTLFNILINSIANLEKKYPSITLAQYADDLAIYIKFDHAVNKNVRINSKAKLAKTHPNFKSRLKQNNERAIKLLEYPTNDLIQQLQNKGFKVNVAKTQCILFGTTDPEKEHIIIDGKIVNVTKTVKYLGITLDYKLLFREHIDDLVARGKKALQILRYLAGKKRGLKARVLKGLYLSYVLPKMTYGEELFTEHKRKGSSTSGVTARKLDVIQNMALSTISRCCKNSSSLALSVLTGIPPLAIRRKEKRVNLWARFIHNPDNPAREIYNDKWEAKNILNRGLETGIVKNTMESLKEMKLRPQMVAKRIKTLDYWNLPTVDVDTTLTKSIDKANTPAEDCKQITQQYIEKYNNRKHIYTDGSKEGKKVGAGFADVHTNTQQSYRLNNNLSITSAELVAIEKSLEYALGDGDERGLLVCTDSLGACMAVRRGITGGSRPDRVQQIMEHVWDMSDMNRHVTICWIPAHVDIAGNDIADTAAKLGRDKPKIDTDIKLSYTELKAINRQHNKHTIFQRTWNEHSSDTIKTIRTYMPHTHNKIGLDNWRLNRLRVMKPKFSFTHKDAWCVKCRTPIDVSHVLLQCAFFQKERNHIDRLLIAQEKRLDLSSILAPTKDAELIHLINKMLLEIDNIFGI